MKTKMKLRATAGFLVLALIAPSASAQSIWLFFDPTCGMCSGWMGQGQVTVAWIKVAHFGAATSLSGADFRIEGLPDEWIALHEPDPASSLSTGDPFDGAGASITFSDCRTGVCVNLYRVTIVPMSSESDIVLTVKGRSDDPLFDCPTISLCDAPASTRICVRGEQSFINVESIVCPPAAVEGETWSALKAFYR